MPPPQTATNANPYSLPASPSRRPNGGVMNIDTIVNGSRRVRRTNGYENKRIRPRSTAENIGR